MSINDISSFLSPDFLRAQLEKLILEKHLEKIFILSTEGKVLVRFIGKRKKTGELKDLLLLVIKQNLDIFGKTALSTALYTNAKGIRTKLMAGVAQIEKSLLEERKLPVMISRKGKIYDRNQNEVDLTPLFDEVKKYLPAHLSGVGEEE